MQQVRTGVGLGTVKRGYIGLVSTDLVQLWRHEDSGRVIRQLCLSCQVFCEHLTL